MSTHTSLRTRNFTISQTFATNNKAPIQQPTINIPASPAPSGVPVSERVTVVTVTEQAEQTSFGTGI